ncbi:MAG: polyprenyl synthetase family protein [Bacteroidales bacterium]|nr:polyprenyl synthetase family protein [Bacteroidales bacterium]
MNIEDRLQDVHREFQSRLLGGEGRLLHHVEQYVAATQGKMLRPRMLLLAAATRGEDALAERRTLLLATAVEMLHNASLLHDDVIDCAADRRGRPSVNHRWSNPIAVLMGDYLLALTMQLLHEAGDAEATGYINHTVAAMVEAELLAQEVAASTDGHSSVSDCATYLRIIDGKTALLFATACALGNPAYEEFGLHYGRLFQLRDDMADGEATPHTASLIEQEEQALATLPPLPGLSV